MKKNPWTTTINKTVDFEQKPGLTSFINPYSFLLLENEYEIAEKIDFWHIDGISLVKAINRSFSKNERRLSFDDTSLAPIVFNFSKENNLKIAIIGTEEKYIHKAVHNIQRKHDVNIDFYRNGYFKNEQEKLDCYQILIEKNIDVVISGMGTPHQENFLIGLKERGWNGYGYTCGGYLHQIASSETYYPTLFNKLELRWLYRIIDEPKLVKRYLVYYPLFFFKFNSFRLKIQNN
ncbi:WecB/TagA/CpsF family glycosyltransferase [Salinimicrobium catena]|uniref:WecB/TagA/CpsF family glycosyltransferase n=1 Tax=Salinimicrobium catena TaxID=390640 RepID=UPI002FE45909